ncbi:MAG: lanthionine synthetase C-like family protein [Thermoleophilia bacterium]|nr:lanthionine synthetase C-like family protein [Thermoleophilia bacterium]
MTTTTPHLYDPALHEPLVEHAWETTIALGGAREIALDALDAGRDVLWPMHPDDAADDDGFDIATCLYFGAAGVALALDWLAREIDTPRPATVPDLFARIRDAHAANPPFTPSPASWLIGRSGVAAAMSVLDDGSMDRVLHETATVIDNPSHDPLCGAGHALLGLLSLIGLHPGDQRLVDLFRSGVAHELAELQAGPADCEMWHVDLYGNMQWMVGAGHGAAGTLQPMLRGAHLLDAATNDRVIRVARELVAATVLRDGGLANWPPACASDDVKRPVQWCHGAPGIILALADAARDDAATRDLLLAGGELTWRAGPLIKGSTICHGTAGNALALLQLFDLTDDELWLDRARRLALHALHQVRRRRDEVGRGRYSLMTGDLGVATCLVQCERARTGIVGLDLF